jgi:hypothetical protein
MHTFKTNDVAVLFSLIAMSELSPDYDGLLGPHITGHIWCLEDLAQEEIVESLKRLEEAGEIQWREDAKYKGWLVVRMEEFQDLMTSFGRRRYNREKQREFRIRSKGATV